MARMLSNGNTKLVWVPAAGISNFHAPTVAELGAAGVVELSCLVGKNNYQFGATGENTIQDPALCSIIDAGVPGTVQISIAMDFFRGTTTDDDKAWATFTAAGIDGWLVERRGAAYSAAFAAAQKVKVCRALTGAPQDLTPDPNGGYFKFRLNFYPQDAYDDRATVAA